MLIKAHEEENANLCRFGRQGPLIVKGCDGVLGWTEIKMESKRRGKRGEQVTLI